MTNTSDAIIIGGGHNGLAAATYLPHPALREAPPCGAPIGRGVRAREDVKTSRFQDALKTKNSQALT
jgi:glycine/D-amino acid oxidase-like deaminating enzyme